MKVIEEKILDPTENEVQVQVKSIGLNFADIFAMLGLYSATPKTPFTPGLEFSGVITKVGKNTENFSRKLKVGDKVYAVTRFGGYSTIINVDNRYAALMPEGWTFQQGAAFLCQTLTAYYGLVELGNLKKNHSVLIHSGGGGVGLQANKICKSIGAYTIGTIGNASKIQTLKDEKYDEIIVREDKNWHQKIQRKPDIVMDAIGCEVMKKSYDIMNKQGRLVVFGGANFTPKKDLNYFSLAFPYLTRAKIDPLEMISDNKSIMGFNLIWLWEKTELFDELMDMLQKLDIGKPTIGAEYPFEKLKDAMQYLQSGKSVGKVVVNV